MKILVVNRSDSRGGAANAAYRQHKALLLEKINSKFLVKEKFICNDDSIIKAKNSNLLNLLSKTDKQIVKWYRKRQSLFSTNIIPNNFVQQINELDADIVHLHWVAGGLLKVEDIPKIKKPVVWTFHDMWMLTGGCHYDNYCNKYKVNCGKCPVLNSQTKYDLSYHRFMAKFTAIQKIKSRLVVVTPSTWLENEVKQSNIFKGVPVLTIPNPIDNTYFKMSKNTAKKKLKIDQRKKVILFAAINSTSDKRKGFQHIKKMLKNINIKKEDYILMIIGADKESNNDMLFGFETKYFGKLFDEKQMNIIYNASDVCIVPSEQENLGTVIMESLSCNTPVLAFNVGGNSDLISHMKNGYLAKPFDNTDFTNGLLFVLNSLNDIDINNYKLHIQKYNGAGIAKRYQKLYTKIINQSL